MLTNIVMNLANSPVRHETLQGRRYMVAPVVMLTEGVHAGSNGPLLYTEDVCRRAIPAWNAKPIVVYHPEIGGVGVSACDPFVLETQQVGMVLNTKWDRGKLRAEAWIDQELAAKVDVRILGALTENQVMEVSTGLFVDSDNKAGTWKGKDYTGAALNHQPDHLALLPDKIGACSVQDGAGLLQLNEAVTDAPGDVQIYTGRQVNRVRALIGNALSHSALFQQLGTLLREKIADSVYIDDVFDDYVIYEKGNALYRVAYSVSKGKDPIVELMGDPEEVTRVVKYEPVKALSGLIGNEQEKKRMDKEQLVIALITNQATAWAETDREYLLTLNEDVLAKMAPVETAQAPVQNASLSDFLASAPPEYREVLESGLAAHNEAKEALVTAITANAACKFTKEFLMAKPVGELRGLAAIAAPAAHAAPVTNASPAMYIGQGTPATPVTNTAVAEPPLLVPTF